MIEEILDAVNEGENSKLPFSGVAILTEAGREFYVFYVVFWNSSVFSESDIYSARVDNFPKINLRRIELAVFKGVLKILNFWVCCWIVLSIEACRLFVFL